MEIKQNETNPNVWHVRHYFPDSDVIKGVEVVHEHGAIGWSCTCTDSKVFHVRCEHIAFVQAVKDGVR